MATAISTEVLFAQKLAANERTPRNRALRKLKKYIFQRSSQSKGKVKLEVNKLKLTSTTTVQVQVS